MATSALQNAQAGLSQPTTVTVPQNKDSTSLNLGTAPAALNLSANSGSGTTAAAEAGGGAALSAILSSLGLSDLSSLSSYLGSTAAGMTTASNAAATNTGLAQQLANTATPYTSEANQLLNNYNTGTLTSAQQNVVNTLNSQGQTLIDSASPLAQIANQAFAQYSAGQLTSGQQAQLDAWTASAKQQLAQTLANSGITDSSLLATQSAAIDSQAQQLKQQLMTDNLNVGNTEYSQWLTSTQAGQQLIAQGAQYSATSLDNMLTQALSLGSLGSEIQTQAIQLAIQSDNTLSTNVANLMKATTTAYAASQGQKAAGNAGTTLSSLIKGLTGGGSGSSSGSVNLNDPSAVNAFGNSGLGNFGTGSSLDSMAAQTDFNLGLQNDLISEGQNSIFNQNTQDMANQTVDLNMPSSTDVSSGAFLDTTAANSVDSSWFTDWSSTDLPDLDWGYGG